MARALHLRTIGLLGATALAATGLVACAPASADRVAALGTRLASLGISTRACGGSEPLFPVTGETVMVLTDWQLQGVAVTLPASTDSDGAIAFGGVGTHELSRTTATLPGASEPDYLDPAAIVSAWWAEAESPRAELVRELVPVERAGALVPTAVLALFVADGLEGRSLTEPDDWRQSPRHRTASPRETPAAR